MITQQTGRYLFKSFRELVAKHASGKFTVSQINNPTLAYMNTYLENPNLKCPATTASQFYNPELQLAAFGHRAASMVAQIVHALDVEKRTWNSMLVDIYNVTVAHCQLVMVQNFILGIRGEMPQPDDEPVTPLSASAKEALMDLSNLFAMHTIHKQPGEFLTSGYLDPSQIALLGKAIMDTMEKKIRPNAIGFVDAFAFPDYLLNSALGAFDGRVYERYTEMATREPLNRTEVVDGYEQYIKPFTNPNSLKGHFRQARL
jgi:acyl-CoA oxidase